MYLRPLILVLALTAHFRENDATRIFSTVDEPEVEETTNDKQIEENENTKINVKRILGGEKEKASFGGLSLELAKLHLMEEINKKSDSVAKLKNEMNEHSPDKCTMIKKVGDPIVHHHSGGRYGAWMRDPLGLLGAETIWYMNGYHNNKVLKFQNMDYFKAGEVSKTYILPYKFDGTGSAVYGRYLYFNRENSNYIVQYDLVSEKMIREKRPNSAITARKYTYQWNGYTTMDISVDESGLWVLYSTSSNSGKLCASLLDPLTLDTLNTYCGISSESMKSMGNAFVACGIVYSIDSYNGRSTTINYAYDTTTKKGLDPRIKFTNKFGYNGMVTYNPREKVLYAWDNKRQITYPLEFEMDQHE